MKVFRKCKKLFFAPLLFIGALIIAVPSMPVMADPWDSGQAQWILRHLTAGLVPDREGWQFQIHLNEGGIK